MTRERAASGSGDVRTAGTPVIHMVLGFLFDETRQRVVLLKKDHGPESVVGKWNGPGGKVRASENDDYRLSIVREFEEEAGLLVPRMYWFLCHEFGGPEWRVQCFAAVGDVDACRTVESEEVRVFDVDEVLYDTTIPLAPNARVAVWAAKRYLDSVR